MADRHDNRATVTLGGVEYELCASKLAERIYGNQFRGNVAELGRSGAYIAKTDAEGNETGERSEIAYSGRLKLDVSVSSVAAVGPTGEIPEQLAAAAWAMAKAAGSTDMTWDEWADMWWSLPSNSTEDLRLWEAVCVDLAERAFFRDPTG